MPFCGKHLPVKRLALKVILLGLIWAIPNFAYATMHAIGGAPDGFEQLSVPRPTSVTVYYGGDLLGSFAAHSTPSSLQFDKPEQIIAAIPVIVSKDIVETALKNALPVHVDLLCTSKRTENCGKLAPDVAGIIYDENSLSAELFINKKYLSVVNQDSTRYLPLPERKFSSVYAFSGAATGTDTQKPTFDLTSDAVYSLGEAKFTSQSTLSNQGLRFDTAAASIDRNGWNETAGFFRSNPMQLITDRDIAGISVSTSTRTLLDSHKTEGNEIIVYLPRRSFVSIYREGHLYSARAYDAGNQVIDTSELPEGAYTITLKIQEIDGATYEETRFFAKNQLIPPAGEPVYYAQAGVIRKPALDDSTVPQLTDDPIVRLGTVRRISDNMGLNLSVLGVQDRATAEAGTFWLHSGAQVQTTVLASTRGDFGVQGGYIQTTNKLSIALDARKMWMNSTPMAGFEDMPRNIAQATASISYALKPEITLGVKGSYSAQDDMPTMSSVGPYAEWRMWQEGENSLVLSGDAARTGGHDEGNVLIRFTHHFGGGYGVSSTAGATTGSNNNGPLGSARIWHDDPTPGNALTLGGGITANGQQQVLSQDADWRNTFGHMQGSVQEGTGQGASALSYAGNFSFNAAQLGSEIHVGGEQNEKSAVIVETHGDAKVKMKVYVNGVQRCIVKVGDKQVVYLTPFHIYNIRLAPEKNGLLDYESGDRKVTLYPGNVVKLIWNINTFYVVVAHFVGPDGKPLANAVLKESRTQVATNSRGRLQAELSSPGVLTFTAQDNSVCQSQLPGNVTAINGVLIYHKAIPCIPISQTASR
jgi:hypothetical protein